MYTVDLFADSFGDQGCLPRPHKTWVDLLSDHYKIKNFSLNGTGAHYHVQKLMDLEKYSDFLLFLMPDLNRLNLDYIEEYHQSAAYLIFKQKESNTFDPNFWQWQTEEHLVKLSDKIHRDYIGFYNTQIDKILELLIVQYVFSKSNVYKKILVWGSSGRGYPFRYNNNITIPSNCHIVQGSLDQISFNEGGRENSYTPRKDPKYNHLCEENHKFLAKSVHDYLKHGTFPDVSKAMKKQSQEPQDFIYD